MKAANRQQLLLVLTIAMVSLFFADRLIFTPLGNLWKARSQEIAKLRRQIDDGSSMIRRAQVIRSKWTQMQTNALPNDSSKALEMVSKAIEDWSQESGVSLNGTTPQWKSGDTDNYKTLVCSVDVSGTIWYLSRFLYDVEKGPMALKVDSIDLSSRDNTGQQLALNLQLNGLVLTSQTK